jgi:hypothetical protein
LFLFGDFGCGGKLILRILLGTGIAACGSGLKLILRRVTGNGISAGIVVGGVTLVLRGCGSCIRCGDIISRRRSKCVFLRRYGYVVLRKLRVLRNVVIHIIAPFEVIFLYKLIIEQKSEVFVYFF